MAKGYGIGYALKLTGLEVTWLADTNVSVRVAQRPMSLAHICSLYPNRRNVAIIQIGCGGNESAVHLMCLQALDA